MLIHILALNGVFDTGLAAVQDTITTAMELGGDPANPAVTARLVGVSRQVKTAQGLSVPVAMSTDFPRPDVVVVPALGAKTPQTLPHALEQPEIAKAGRLLREWQAAGAIIAASCTGTFVLAEAGLLVGRTATTSWWLAPLFRSRYPKVVLDDSRMLVRAGDIITAGAALAHFDLALWLVRQVSPTLATITARHLLIDPRASQAAYAIPDHLSHSDAVVERFEHWARENLSRGFSLDEAARVTGASRRTLARRMQTVLGKSPLAYFQDLRIERAVHLLQTTKDSVDDIANQVGYADGVTLRTLLRRRIGRSASTLRKLHA
jgi:transcriptional regulator GlxA family with amidase domain